jgi:hypothetical protein
MKTQRQRSFGLVPYVVILFLPYLILSTYLINLCNSQKQSSENGPYTTIGVTAPSIATTAPVM